MYSVVVHDENYSTHIYNLSLTTQNLRCLYQMGIDINTFLTTMPNIEELCLFFTICLQSNNVMDGERFIDDFLVEHSVEDLVDIIPHFFAVEIGITYDDETTVNDSDNVPSEPQNEATSVVKILDDYLNACMILGLTEAEFNAMTLAEVKRWLEAHEKRRLRELQEEAMIAYISVDLIGVSVGRLMSRDIKYPQFVDAFVNLFSKEEIAKIEEDKAKREREEFIAKFKAMAENHNERIDAKETNNKNE